VHKLPVLCASILASFEQGLQTGPCEGKTCVFWQSASGECGAGTGMADDYRRWFKPDSEIPSCPIADRCRWNIGAVNRGEPACGVRRLGMLCEHQGGDWNTFEMASPDDEEAWGSFLQLTFPWGP